MKNPGNNYVTSDGLQPPPPPAISGYMMGPTPSDYSSFEGSIYQANEGENNRLKAGPNGSAVTYNLEGIKGRLKLR